MNNEFRVHTLNDIGISKTRIIASLFDSLLNQLKSCCPEGRELSLVKTKLEEACFFAKKAIAGDISNQKGE